ncbi:lmo0937 family membrane protein [Neobacillus ginsengisoli]|uniref:Membrane protein n=1 Tax=Neobacillus ginsengisoli TaxID=904295 RepID=A0ABT9XX93_9BACI|nr:lmo0937 family membrane protein [Neobacillus ginsengisoli]MDQ0200193.1 putative membrane protein [Neobacillus ginsengisoli]
MIKTIIGLLILFWVLGIVFHLLGGLIHILLVIAVVMFLFKLISGRNRHKG